MMYLCKFGQNISTRCSDKMQISFFLLWVGYFGIVFGIEKSSHDMHIVRIYTIDDSCTLAAAAI